MWRSVRRTCGGRGGACGGGPHGGACAKEAHMEEGHWRSLRGGGTRGKAQVVELYLRMPCWYVSASVIYTGVHGSICPHSCSLISGVACPCPASLPDTPRSVHLSTFSETCLDEAKSSLSLKATMGLVCGCVRSWAASLSCPPLLGVRIQQEDKSGTGTSTCFCPYCSSASFVLTSFRTLSSPGRLQPLGLYIGCSMCPG